MLRRKMKLCASPSGSMGTAECVATASTSRQVQADHVGSYTVDVRSLFAAAETGAATVEDHQRVSEARCRQRLVESRHRQFTNRSGGIAT
jgi:hypothetical protein